MKTIQHIFIILLISTLTLISNTNAYSQMNPLMNLPEYTSFEEIPYPFEVHKVQLSNEVELAYVDQGTGNETIIFIHGLGSYLPAWKKNIEVLRNNYRCIAIDLPGYGKSSKLPHSGMMTYYASVINELVDSLKLDKVYLAGHSMGGQISLVTAIEYPEIVKALILAAPAGFEHFSAGQKEWFRQVMTLKSVMKTPVEAIQTNLYYNFYKMPEDAQFMIDDRIAMRSAKDFEAYSYAVVQSVHGMVNEPVLDHLEEIEQPVLIVFGENDNLIPNRFLNPGFTKKIAEVGHEKLANSQLVMLPKTGHFLMFENPEGFNKAVKDFVK
ncbi:MAG: alpha/beta hydrolase [Bacteroidales bacterium]|nr:alpha/beta hydrolase [Bacteroidales bacterium]